MKDIKWGILLSGKPGAGKGLATKNIIKVLAKRGEEIEVISVSGILKNSPKCQKFMESGELVPDEYVIQAVIETLQKQEGNFILDGFPRTIAQAEALTAAINDKLVIWNLEVSDEVVIERVATRKTCSKCGATYSLSGRNAPKVMGKCDQCGGTLIVRPDETKIAERLKIYSKETAPAIELLVANGFPVLNIDSFKIYENDIEKYLEQTVNL